MSDDIKKLLRLKELGMVIYGHFFDEEDNFVIKVGRPHKGARCPTCASFTRKRHQKGTYRRLLHHLDVGGRRVYLKLRQDRYWCPHCQRPFTESFPFAPKHSRMTLLAMDEIRKLLRRQSFSFVEKHYRIAYKTAVKVLQNTPLNFYRWEGPVSLGIDAHSFSGHRLVTTITDLTRQEVIHIVPDARQSSLKKTLEAFPPLIREVCIDMDEGIRSAVRQALPQAQIVLDHFHLIQDANRRLDEARRIEQEVEQVTIPKRIFLVNEEELDKKGRRKLKRLKDRYPLVCEFHWVKESLREIYRLKDKQKARGKLSDLIVVMEKSDQIEIKRWAKTLRRWREEILAFFDQGTTNAYTEGVHTKMKLIKRISYGFGNVEIYIRKVLLAFVPISVLCSYHG